MDIDAKLNMSLDDLANKDKAKQQQQRGDWHRQGRFNNNGAGGHQQRQEHHQQRPFRVQGQAPAYAEQQQRPWGQQQQQHWGRRQGDPQRPSVFARLGGGGAQGTGNAGAGHAQQPSPPPRRQQQQQHHQHQQHQQRSDGPSAAAAKPAPKVHCRLDTDTGLVVITHGGIDIIKVGPGGDVLLDRAGDQSASMLDAFNAALAPLKMSVKAAGDPSSSTWSVSDGKGLLRFSDGMKLPAKGPVTAGRAMVLMQAFAAGSSKAAAAAAQQASTQAAIAAGILPAATGAAAAGGGSGGPQRAAAGSGGAAEGPDVAQIRRLKAQGRYQPY